MKRTFLAFLVLCLCTTAFSQTLSSAKIPQAVKESFAKAHPNMSVTWEREGINYEANFKEAGKAMSCVIDKRGTILETESPVGLNELPAAARDYVAQHEKGKKIKEVAKIAKANGAVNYEVNVQGKDILFDGNGTRIDKPKEKNEKD